MNAETSRIQCTPDMLPGDITGSSVIDTNTMSFSFQPGPVFTNILLVDEINRATPKTQSALLEAMAERNVTIEGTSHRLPDPFLVLATQNPVELAGTFPLPEAQLDRFLFKLSMGYPDIAAMRKVLRGNAVTLEVESIKPVCDTADIVAMIQSAATIDMSEPVETYILELCEATRSDSALLLGAGPRAALSLLRASRALAAADGRAHVLPEDVKSLLRPVLAHRLMLSPDATLRGESVDGVLERIIARVKPPLNVDRAPVVPIGNAAPNRATARRARRAAQA
jgi:MoxR-like ATPase